MRSAVAVGVTQVGEVCYGTVGIEFQVVVQPHHLLHRPAGSPKVEADSDSKQNQIQTGQDRTGQTTRRE